MKHEKDYVLSELELARIEWLPHHRKAERADGFNAESNRNAAEVLEPIDRLLDELAVFVLQKTVEI